MNITIDLKLRTIILNEAVTITDIQKLASMLDVFEPGTKAEDWTIVGKTIPYRHYDLRYPWGTSQRPYYNSDYQLTTSDYPAPMDVVIEGKSSLFNNNLNNNEDDIYGKY